MRKIALSAIIILAAFLRFYKLDSVPPSLYWDEASLGYNAYSILVSGHDEHGKIAPLTNFAAFGDYKPPGYIYATVPSIALFGLNEFAIRFPSALSGTLTVLLTYLIARHIFEGRKEKLKILDLEVDIALIASFFLAISPWHLGLSRAAFEANLALFFSTLGVYLFLKFEKSPFWILPSFLSFLVAIYTFTGQRLFVPFIILVLVWHFRREILSNLKIVISACLIFAILFWPLFIFATKTIEGRLRFEEVTIFRNLEPINQSINYRQADNFTWWSNIIHNRRIFRFHEYLLHYFDAFDPDFLFTRGDVNPRLSNQYTGQLYYIDLPLILTGIYFLFAKKQKYRFLILGWLLISPLGPATARETPHALRMLHILPTYQLISAYGLFCLYEKIKYKKMTIIVVALLLSLNVIYYLHMYYLHWPINYALDWQYGYRQAAAVALQNYDQFDQIVVAKSYGRPYIYFLLYMHFSPQEYLRTAKVVRDNFYFLQVESFDKFVFTDEPNNVATTGKILYIVTPSQVPQDAKKLKTITDPLGKEVFIVAEASRD